MTGKEFLNSLAKGKADILQQLLGILTETGSDYCLIGGLAVNAYVEPVVSLDVDIVVAVDNIVPVANAARTQKMKVASLDNVLQGKVWAFMDDTRRRSKRQKDLADISRIIETYPELTSQIPQKVKDQLQEK